MPNSNSNSNNSKAPKKFTTTPPAGAASPVGLRFSHNSNYSNASSLEGFGGENISTVRGNGSNNGLNELSEFNRNEEFPPPGTPTGVLNNLSVWTNNKTATTWSNNKTATTSSNNSNNTLPAYLTKNRTSRNNQLPRITAKNMEEYPKLGGRIFSNSKTPKKPGKRNNGKNRKSRKTRRTRKNRK
jgi:hypothetical protein